MQEYDTTTICDGVASPQGACAVWCRVCSAPLPAATVLPPPPGMRNVRDRCHRQSPFHHHYSPRVLSPSLRASRASGVCVSSRRTDLALYRETLKLADILNSLRYSCYGCRVRIRIRQSFRGVCHVRDDVILTSSIRICEMDVESTCRSGLGSPRSNEVLMCAGCIRSRPRVLR